MGGISEEVSLSGMISGVGELSGKISVAKEYAVYDGAYEIVPKVSQTQTLPTGNRILKQDIIVREIPFYEAKNESDGMTAYIGKDIKNGL